MIASFNQNCPPMNFSKGDPPILPAEPSLTRHEGIQSTASHCNYRAPSTLHLERTPVIRHS